MSDEDRGGRWRLVFWADGKENATVCYDAEAAMRLANRLELAGNAMPDMITFNGEPRYEYDEGWREIDGAMS